MLGAPEASPRVRLSSLVPLVGGLLAVAARLCPHARDIRRRVGVEDLALRVRHLALRAAGRPALAEALHPAEETVHAGVLPDSPALTPRQPVRPRGRAR